MKKEFSKDIFMSNVYHLLRAKGVKVGELEKDVGISIGYLSKLNKEASLKPGIDLVIRIAERLEVSIDALIGLQMEKVTGTELYNIRFLEKLRKDTEAEKLMWGRETASELAVVGNDENGFPTHPFFTTEEYTEDRGGDYPEFLENNVFVSNEFGPETAIHGDCYNLRLKNGAILFLADVVKSCYRQNETDVYAKEVWIKTNFSPKQFICSNKNSHYANFVNNLFTAIAEYVKHPQMPSDYRYVIDAFMQDDLEDDPPCPEVPPF